MPSLVALPSLSASAYGLRVGELTKPAWAGAITHRRTKELGISQEMVVANSGDATLTQSDISRIERGALHPTEQLPSIKFFALLRGLEWTVDEFTAVTGIEPPYRSQEQAAALAAAKYLEERPDYVMFPVYSAASAGATDADPIEGGVAFITKAKLREKGADPRYVVIYRVNGDCMVSAEARRIEKNIVHGDNIAVDTRRRPQTGDTVVAWWPDEQKLVVKRYKIERENIILYPLAPAAPTLQLPLEDDVNIIGVVIWREG